MQAAQLPHHPVPGAQVQVIGVGELHLTADVLQILGAEGSFNGALGAHIHKNRRLDRAVGAGKHAPPGLALCFQQFKHTIPPRLLQPPPSPEARPAKKSFRLLPAGAVPHIYTLLFGFSPDRGPHRISMASPKLKNR